MSLSRNGTPAKGPDSVSSQRLRAISNIGPQTALIRGFSAVLRAIAASSSSRGRTSRRATSSARPVASCCWYCSGVTGTSAEDEIDGAAHAQRGPEEIELQRLIHVQQ